MHELRRRSAHHRERKGQRGSLQVPSVGIRGTVLGYGYCVIVNVFTFSANELFFQFIDTHTQFIGQIVQYRYVFIGCKR